MNDLRQLPEKRMACALQIAKQADYSPKSGTLMTFSHRWRSGTPCLWSPQKVARILFKGMDTRIHDGLIGVINWHLLGSHLLGSDPN